jgi:hypothetical protein
MVRYLEFFPISMKAKMKSILSLVTLSTFSLASGAQAFPDTWTTISQEMKKSRPTDCAASNTPDEQFARALSYKNDGNENEIVACQQPAADAGHAAAQELLSTSYAMGKRGLPMTRCMLSIGIASRETMETRILLEV